MNGERPDQASEPVIDLTQPELPAESTDTPAPKVIDQEVMVIPLFPERGPFGGADRGVKL
jgi:hypothetical protein